MPSQKNINFLTIGDDYKILEDRYVSEKLGAVFSLPLSLVVLAQKTKPRIIRKFI